MSAGRGWALVFDLDGTLIDSAPAIMGVGNRLLAERGLAPLDLAETRAYIGNGAGKFVERALAARGETRFDGAYERFETLYAEADPAENRPYDGVGAALRGFAEEGFALGLCTNKPGVPTEKVVAALGWAELFETVVAGDTLAVRKPDPAPLTTAIDRLGARSALYIGDSEVDAETAARAKTPFLLHAEGYRKTPLDAIAHDAAFSHFAALPALVARFVEAA